VHDTRQDKPVYTVGWVTMPGFDREQGVHNSQKYLSIYNTSPLREDKFTPQLVLKTKFCSMQFVGYILPSSIGVNSQRYVLLCN
jgi:hypothetical protein